MKALLREAAADFEEGQTSAEGWDQAAALAALNADPAAALWAELEALKLQWDDVFATNAGIYLYYLDKSDDAKLFLHCAYDMGGRSPFLLEALANVYRRTGDKEKAGIFIRAAEAAAPADAFIKVEKALTETGRPPVRPPAQDDPLERAFTELQMHQRSVLAAIKQSYELQDRVDADSGVPEDAQLDEEYRRDRLGILQTGWLAGDDAICAMISRQADFTGDGGRAFRNAVFGQIILYYLEATSHLLSETGSVRMIWCGSSLDLSFWGEALGFGPVQLNRMFLARKHLEHNGIQADGLHGERGVLDDFAGALFSVASRQAELDRTAGYEACRLIGSSQGQAYDSCNLEVERTYCALMRELFGEYVAESEMWFQKAARRFDRVAARRIAWGAVQVEDAFVHASTYAREMRIAPGHAGGSDLVLQALQSRYQDLVKLVFEGDEYSNHGPGDQIRSQAASYRLQKQNAEREHEDIGSSIERDCAPVDRKVLEQLLEEQRLAIQSMLLDRLNRDFDAEWNPTLSCSISGGKWFSAGIEDTGKVSLGGKWKWLDKKFPGASQGPDQVEVARNYKINFKDGELVGVTAGIEGNAKYGPFTGKGSATLGVAWNAKKNGWDYPVELGGTLGIGFKTKGNFGATCYPGKARVKFEARAVAKDAWAYVQSLDGD